MKEAKRKHKLDRSRPKLIVLPVILASILLFSNFLTIVQSSTIAERELARKLIKLFLAAAVLSPPGLGAFPLPVPFPVPFGIETLKPPIYAPYGFPFLHGGGFGGGLGGIGIGHAAAASDITPVIALPVVRAGSAAANNAITKIPVTLPKLSTGTGTPFIPSQVVSFPVTSATTTTTNPNLSNFVTNNNFASASSVQSILSNLNNLNNHNNNGGSPNNNHQTGSGSNNWASNHNHYTPLHFQTLTGGIPVSAAASQSSSIYVPHPMFYAKSDLHPTSSTTTTTTTTVSPFSFLNPTPNPQPNHHHHPYLHHQIQHPFNTLFFRHKKR